MKTKKEVHQAKAAEFAAQVKNVLTGLTNAHLGDYTTKTSDPEVVRDPHTGAFTYYRVTFIIESSVEGFIAMVTFMSDGTANVVSPESSSYYVTHLAAFNTVRTML